MKLNNIKQVKDFLSIVDKCRDTVWLESTQGDKYNLKSILSQYIAIGALISHHGNELELYCSNADDEALFMNFFKENPETL